MSVDRVRERIDSKITKQDIDLIKKRDNKIQQKTELITGNKIHIKPSRFVCENCGAHAISRSSQHGKHKKPKFHCRECSTLTKFVYDKKQGIAIEFDEYSEIMNNQI
ncbi:MAG: hypothetical protein ACOCT9_00960 [archaeon]